MAESFSSVRPEAVRLGMRPGLVPVTLQVYRNTDTRPSPCVGDALPTEGGPSSVAFRRRCGWFSVYSARALTPGMRGSAHSARTIPSNCRNGRTDTTVSCTPAWSGMKRAWPIVVLIATLAVAGLCDVSRATARPETPRADHVTIVLAPYLTWADVTATTTPNLWRMAEQGAVGAVNSRARFAGFGGARIADRSRARAVSWGVGPARLLGVGCVQRDRDGGGFPDCRGGIPSRLRRRNGRGAPDVSGAARHAANSTTPTRPASVLGSLGQAVRDANGLTAAVGNSDSGLAEQARRAH